MRLKNSYELEEFERTRVLLYLEISGRPKREGYVPFCFHPRKALTSYDLRECHRE